MVNTLFKKKTIERFYLYFFKQMRVVIEYKFNRSPKQSPKQIKQSIESYDYK